MLCGNWYATIGKHGVVFFEDLVTLIEFSDLVFSVWELNRLSRFLTQSSSPLEGLEMIGFLYFITCQSTAAGFSGSYSRAADACVEIYIIRIGAYFCNNRSYVLRIIIGKMVDDKRVSCSWVIQKMEYSLPSLQIFPSRLIIIFVERIFIYRRSVSFCRAYDCNFRVYVK